MNDWIISLASFFEGQAELHGEVDELVWFFATGTHVVWWYINEFDSLHVHCHWLSQFDWYSCLATCFRNMQIVILCKLHCIFCMLVIWTSKKIVETRVATRVAQYIHHPSTYLLFHGVAACSYSSSSSSSSSPRSHLIVAFSSAASNPTVSPWRQLPMSLS